MYFRNNIAFTTRDEFQFQAVSQFEEKSQLTLKLYAPFSKKEAMN